MDINASDIKQKLEIHRIRTHLRRVEQLLLNIHFNPRSQSQTVRRYWQLQHLHQYWAAGKFPRNRTHPHQQVPCFIDADGHLCAVAHLLIADGCSGLALYIARQANFAYIREMAFPELQEWVTESGLTLPELALIQPDYLSIACPSHPSNLNSPPPLLRSNNHASPQMPSLSTKIKFIPVPAPASVPQAPLPYPPQCSVALVLPVDQQNLTTSAYPTFLVYLDAPLTLVCSSSDWLDCGFEEHELYAEFLLQDNKGKVLYSHPLTLPAINTPSILRISVPKTGEVSPLEVGRQYRWKLTILKPEFNRDAESVEGVIRRVPLQASLTQQLAVVSPREQAEIYARQGIWYDTLALLAALRQEYPNDPELTAAWDQSIEFVGDRRAAKALLVSPGEAFLGGIKAFLTDPSVEIIAALILLVGGTGYRIWFCIKSSKSELHNPERRSK